jgi:hypothetical protein
MYYNVDDGSQTGTDAFAFTSDVTVYGPRLDGPSAKKEGLFFNQFMGSFYKAPTNGRSQWWDPARVAQTFLTHNFQPTTTCVSPSGIGTIGWVENTLSMQNYNTPKTNNTKVMTNTIFNGGQDRQIFKTPDEDANHIFNYLPEYNHREVAAFLTHYNERNVDLLDTGSLACLTGVFSGYTAQGGGSSNYSLSTNTSYFDYTTYDSNGNVKDLWTIRNPYAENNPFDANPTLQSSLGNLYKSRVTIPAYPANLQQNTPWVFFDNYFSTGNFGMIGLTPHNFQVGDTIYVNQDPGYTFAGYNGAHTIINIPSPYIIETNQGWLGSTPANGGSAIKTGFGYGDGCSLTIINDVNYGFYDVINNGGFSEFLFAGTWMENVAPDTRVYINDSFYYNTDGGYYGTPSGPNSILTNMPYQGLTDTGTMCARTRMPSSTQDFWSGTGSYKIQFVNKRFEPVGVERGYNFDSYGTGSTFNIVDKCGKHDRIELTWLGKLGAFDSMLFQGMNTKDVTFTKENYTKRLGSMNYSQYIYDTIQYNNNDFELQNFNGYQTTTYTVSTGWITEMEGERVIECMGSNVVYMYKDQVYTPVITTVEDVRVKTKDNNKLVYYTISLELTYNRESQRR